jgi:hypothetical protein
MTNINVKFNNGDIFTFTYNTNIIGEKLISDIGKHLYNNKYNPQINQYIKIIHLGKIINPTDTIIYEEEKTLNYYCIIRKIPDSVFIVEQSPIIKNEKVEKLINNNKFKDLMSQRVVYDFIIANLESPERIISIINAISSNNVLNVRENLNNKYSLQLKVLHDMGFTNDNEMIALLTNTNGNIETVINILMS